MKEALLSHIPGLRLAARYRRADLAPDLIAGVVLAGLLVPQGMAYATLAGLPTINGLYTTVIVLIAYAVFGPSRMLVLGPDSSLGPLIAAAIIPLAAGSPEQAVLLAGMLGLMVGAIAIGLGLGHLGFIADLLSKPVRVGYLCGLAVTIFLGQLPKLFGFSVDADNVLEQVTGFLTGLPQTQPLTLAFGLGVIATMVLLRRIAPRWPGVLIAVVGAMLASLALGLAEKGVAVVGELPQGLPHFQIPLLPVADLAPLAIAAGGIALVSLADTISTAASFAARRGDDVHADQELVALGAANVLAGLFQGFPVSSSGSRTAVAEEAGSRTQVTGLAAAALVAVMLVATPGLVASLPQSALAGVVIVAAFALFDARELGRFMRVRPSEFYQALVALLGVLVFGVLEGIMLAVVISVLNFFRRAWWPHDAVLGKVHGLAGLHDLKYYPDAQQVPGLIVYRFDAPLFFANSRAFHDRVLELIAQSAEPIRWFVVAAEPITDIEATAADMLLDLDRDLNARGIHFVFAELKDPVYQRIAAYELERDIPPTAFYPTVNAAVRAYRAETGITALEGPEDAEETADASGASRDTGA